MSINGNVPGYNNGAWQKVYTFPLSNSQYVHSILCSVRGQYNTLFLNVTNFSGYTCTITATNILPEAVRQIYDLFIVIFGS